MCSEDVNISLRLINQFIGYNLHSIISSIIHIAELKLNEKEISSVALDFPRYLQYGLQNRIELDLIEIGFSDRIGVIELGKILNKIEYMELNELKKYINENNPEIIKNIKEKLPKIVFDKIKKTLSLLKFNI